MKKLIIILAVILVCIIIVGGVLIFMGTVSEKPQQDTATTPVETSQPTETTAPETKETEPTETVALTTASETQEETTEPSTAPTTEATQPEETNNDLPEVDKTDINGTVTASGSFASSTGAMLDVQVNWQSFEDSDGNRKVRLDISLNCCNLYVGARYDGLTITLGGTTKTLNTDAIDYTGSSTNILIGSTVMDLPEGATDCTVSWAYRGSYNQIKIDTITASGTIN